MLYSYPEFIKQIAVGTREPVAVWFMKLDRIGVGYRRGDSIEGIRLILASVFE